MVRFYPVAMLVHVLGLIAVFAGFAMAHRAGTRLRRATRFDEARPWAELLGTTRPMPPSGAVMLLLSGGYMGSPYWASSPPWLIVAALSVVFIGAVTSALVSPGIRAMERAVATGEGALTTAARDAIMRPRTWSLLSAANGAALGTIWLMTRRPGWIEATLVVLVPTIAGAIAGWRLARAPVATLLAT